MGRSAREVNLKCTTCGYYQRQIQIQIIGSDSDFDTGDLIITGVQPSNAVKSRLHFIVFILVFKSGQALQVINALEERISA